MTAPCDPPPVVPGSFVVGSDGNWRFEGALTFDTASHVLEQSRTLPLPKGGRVDLSGLTLADSSALALMLALRRRASVERHKLHFLGQPETLVSLGRVYGIEDLLGS